MKTHSFNHFYLASSLISLFLFLTTSLNAQKPIDLQSGLVAYYSFNNSANDSSGNNLHGETINVNLDRDVSGEKKGSYRWNSKKDQIKLPIDMNVGAMPQVSLCAWVQPQKYAGQMIVISNDDRGEDRKLFTAIKDNKLVWACSNGKEGFIGNTPVENKKWVFLVATYDEKTKTAAIYVDGIKTSGSTQMDMGASYTLIGANPRGNEKFEGLIDEVRIYSRILSKSEIDSLRNLKPIVNQIEAKSKSYFYLVKQDNLIVHAKPNIESKSVGNLNAVDTLRFTETVPTTGGKYAEWLKIKVAGKTGYVQLKYLKHTSTENETKTELQKTLDKYVDWSKWQFWVGMLVFLIIGYWASLKFAGIDRFFSRIFNHDYEGNTAFFPIFMAFSAVAFAVLMVIWQDGIEYYLGENFSIWPVGYGFSAWAIWVLIIINTLSFLLLLYESLFCGHLLHGLIRVALQILLAAILFITTFVISIAIIMIVIIIVVGGILLSTLFYRRVYTDGWGNTYVD